MQEEQDKQEDLDWFATPTVPLNGSLSEFVRTASAAGLKSVPSPKENEMSEKRDDDSSLSKENLPPVDEHPTKQDVVSTATSRVPPQPTSISEANVVVNAQQMTSENQSRPPLSRKQEKKAKKKLARAEKAQREALAQLAISSGAANTATATSSSQMQVSNHLPARVDANAQVVKLGVSTVSLHAYIDY